MGLGGDIIVGINGQDVKTSEQYAKVFRQLEVPPIVPQGLEFVPF
jgi:type II secretory pathway component PulC